MTLFSQKKQFILCINSETRLSVVLDAAPYATLPERLPENVFEALKVIGVPHEKAEKEMNLMSDYRLSKANNRSVTGSLVDMRKTLVIMNNYERLELKAFALTKYLLKIGTLVLPEFYPSDAALLKFGEPIKPYPRTQK
jgi:hypothetical protein